MTRPGAPAAAPSQMSGPTNVARRRTGMIVALFLSLVVGLLMAAAGQHAAAQDSDAGPWPQWTKDAAHTRQVDAAGPDDPGLAWWVDVAELTPDGADEPYEAARRFPALTPDGDVLVTAEHPDDGDGGHLLALDGDDGTIRWAVDEVRTSCGQAVDSQGRIWVQRTDEGPPWPIEALDPEDGEPHANTRLDAFGCSGDPNHLQIGGDLEHLIVVGGRGIGFGAEIGLAAYDISGASPTETWRLTDADPALDNMIQASQRHKQVLVTDDSVYAAVEVEDADEVARPELIEVELSTGDVVDRLTIPVDLTDADHDEPRALDIEAVSFARVGDMLVLGVEVADLSDARGLLAGVDLTTGLDAIAWQEPTGVDEAFTDGPRGLTVADGAVVLRDAAAGAEPLRAFDPATGDRLWTGERERAYPVTGPGGRVADADGALYVHAPGEDVGLDRDMLARLDATGDGAWFIPDAVLEQTMGLDEDELWRDLVVATLDDERLVVTEDPEASAHDAGRVIAIDNSGGLAEAWPDEAAAPDERIAGEHRIATSVELSRQFNAADTVVLATAQDYPDSLAGAPLASQLGAPILLTLPSRVPAEVADEIERLGADRAVLLGGEAALGPGVEGDLEAIGIDDIERFAGETRFHTAGLVALAVQEEADTASAYVVEGAHADPDRGWPDAVGVSGLAAYEEQPILLVTRNNVPRRTAQAAEFFTDFTIVGGEGAVSEDVESWFRSLDEMSEEDDVTVDRVAGLTRYDTSARIADRSLAAGVDPSVVYLATGGNWPDSLSAAPVAGATAADLGVRGGVLLLVHGADLSFSADSAEWLEANAADIDSVTAVGGTAAISDKVLVDAQALVE